MQDAKMQDMKLKDRPVQTRFTKHYGFACFLRVTPLRRHYVVTEVAVPTTRNLVP